MASFVSLVPYLAQSSSCPKPYSTLLPSFLYAPRWDAQDMRKVKEKLEALEAEAKEISRGRSKQALADK